MIVQVSPVEKNVGETLASLNFAQRVRSVELGQATKRLDNNENERVPLEVSFGDQCICLLLWCVGYRFVLVV